MTDIRIETQGDKLSVVTPYHPTFPAGAKRLGGKWNVEGRAWSFDAREEQRVRELVRDVYGTDGADVAAADLVRVRLVCATGDTQERGGIFACGRKLVAARGRDSGATLGDGVILLAGGVGSGGSVKNWDTVVKPGSVFEMLDVPRDAVDAPGYYWTAEIVEEVDAARAALQLRIDTLREELAAAEAELAAMAAPAGED